MFNTSHLNVVKLFRVVRQPKAKVDISVVASLSLPVLKLITGKYCLLNWKHICLRVFIQS